MKISTKILIVLSLLLVPLHVWSAPPTPTTVNKFTDHIEPNVRTDYIKANHFVATSTTATSTFAGLLTVGTNVPINGKTFLVDGDSYFVGNTEFAGNMTGTYGNFDNTLTVGSPGGHGRLEIYDDAGSLTSYVDGTGTGVSAIAGFLAVGQTEVVETPDSWDVAQFRKNIDGQSVLIHANTNTDVFSSVVNALANDKTTPLSLSPFALPTYFYANGFGSSNYCNPFFTLTCTPNSSWDWNNDGIHYIVSATSSGAIAFAVGGGQASDEDMRISSNGNVGIGTTSPGTLLSLGNTGNNTVNISATATSTFGSGINLRTGCFAVNGTCVGGGSSSTGASTTLLADNNTWSGSNDFINANIIENPADPGSAILDIGTKFRMSSDESGLGTLVFTRTDGPSDIFQYINSTDTFWIQEKFSVTEGITVTGGQEGKMIQGTNGTATFSEGSKVGIGTTSPYALLTVQGNHTDTTIPYVPNFFVIASTTPTATSTHFVVTAGGNTGIGTTSPYAKLSVVGPVIAEYFHATSTTATSTFGDIVFNNAYGTILPLSDTAANLSSIVPQVGERVYETDTTYTKIGDGTTNVGNLEPTFGFVSPGTTGQFPFYQSAGSTLTGTSTLFLATTGRIGIGTTSPAALLDVHGNVVLSGTGRTIAGSAASVIGGTTGADITLIGGAGSGSGGGSIVGNGGVGTTGGAVTITAGSSANGGATNISGGGGQTGGGVNITGGTSAVSATGPNIVINGGAGATTRGNVLLGSLGGKIGIGTTSPYAQLSVVGETVASYFTATTTTATSTMKGGFTAGANAGFSVLSGATADSLTVSAGGQVKVLNAGLTVSGATLGGAVGGNGAHFDFYSGNVRFFGYNYNSPGYHPVTINDSIVVKGGAGNVAIGNINNAPVITPLAKLFVEGSASIGSGYGTVAPPTNGLTVQGSVGVGTTSPYRTFSVNGTSRFDDYIYAGKQIGFDVGSAGPLYFGNFEAPTGNRGGFSVPGTVIFGVDASNKRFGAGGTGAYFAANNPSGLFEVRGKANEIQLDIRANGTQTANILQIESSAGTANYMVVDGDGDVGIGTSSPAGKFSVQGASANSATAGTCFRAKNANANSYTYWYFPTAGAAPTYQTNNCGGAATTTVTFD